MTGWDDGYWSAADGVRLHYRDYHGPTNRLPILCVPGLTRNARDFAAVADRLAGERRLICVDIRGRGESGHSKDPARYAMPVYLDDLQRLIGELGLHRIIVFGTSMGGVLAMMLEASEPGRVAGALLNDIGPVIEQEGLAYIRGYVGRQPAWPSWLHAARYFQELLQAAHPKFALEDWVAFAKRVCRLNANGRIILDYDLKIAEPMKAPDQQDSRQFDFWPVFDALAGVPLLLVRGALSTILSAATAEAMVARAADAELLTLPEVGHAPTLTEEGCPAAIDRLLQRVPG